MTDPPAKPFQEINQLPANLNGGNGPGRPSKRTAELESQLLGAIEAGASFKLACELVSITEAVFCLWRREDPDFAASVDAASAKGDLARIKTIDGHGAQDWRAPAWLLERRRPTEYGRQAAQINLSATAAAAVGNGAGRNTETIIVSDLEFVGLQRHPAYRHEPAVCELEQVPAEVSGSLKREGHNIVVISESKVAARAQRSAEVRAKTLALFAAHNQGNLSRDPSSVSPGPSNDAPEFLEKPSEAERFPSAVQQMAANVRGFFESED